MTQTQITDEEKQRARDDLEKAPRRGLRNALITLAGVAVFAGFIVGTGLTWGFTLPTITFAASWGLLGAGITWGVGFWANRRNRLIKKAQKQTTVKRTGKSWKKGQNLSPEAVATNDKKLQKTERKLSKRKRGEAVLEVLKEESPVTKETEEAQNDTAGIQERAEQLGNLQGAIKGIDTTIDPSTIDASKVNDVNARMVVSCGDNDIKDMPLVDLDEVKYDNEYAQKKSYFHTLQAIKNNAGDLCFPITVTRYSTIKDASGKDIECHQSGTYDSPNAKNLDAAIESAREDFEKCFDKCKIEEHHA